MPAAFDPAVSFAVSAPSPGARQHLAALSASGPAADADLLRRLLATPQAVWFSRGEPAQVQEAVRQTVAQAAPHVPVLVAYNLPFRDCAQFSAGGATTVEEYQAWIRAFAHGLGHARAVVILEPDSLGIIPWYTSRSGAEGASAFDWCRPPEADPATAAAERFAMLNAAVDALKALPHTRVYLDGTHSAWLPAAEAAHRLLQAGVARADGFYLNVSNYQFTDNLLHYGAWISSALAYATRVVPGDFRACPGPAWNGAPLSPYGRWRDDSPDPTRNPSAIHQRYAALLGSVQPTTRFVIDTSRNGQGPWQPPPGAYPDPQAWCNPPGRGLGPAPSAAARHPLLDACLWIKTPGESDGECTRGLGPAGATVDPVWGGIDPAAGQWFPQMALDLARNADPPL
jgi:endoglucanase